MAPVRSPRVHLLLVVGAGLVVSGLQPPDATGNEVPMEPGDSHEGLVTSLPEPGSESGGGIDPREAWLLFVRQNDKGANSKRLGRTRARRLRLSLPGPPGPPGPQGPPGPIVSPEVLLKEFQVLLRGAVQQREHGEGSEPCGPRGPGEEEPTGDVLTLLAAALAPGPRTPRIEAAFHCRLRRDTPVERRALQELGGYYLPAIQGVFGRGPGLNLTSGQYSAPVGGLYALAATLHMALAEPPRRGPPRPRDHLCLLICIQSRCQSHASLEAVLGLGGGSELFSISVSGVLHLQTGQYASVFLDNASGSLLTARAGSVFSAVLLGV